MPTGIIIAAVGFGVLAVIGLLIYANKKYEEGRSEKLRAVAEELGLTFSVDADAGVAEKVGQLRLFSLGHSRRSRNMLAGRSSDVEIAIFEYRYVTGSGKNSQTHHQTVIIFQSDHLQVPEFELRPEHVFHKIGQAFGYADIDFDSHPEFSKLYLLRGPDEKAVRDFFTSERLNHFQLKTKVSVEAANDRLVFYRAGKRVKPEDIRSLMEEGFSVYGNLKE